MIRYIRRIESCPARHLASALPVPDTLSVLLPLSVVWDPLEIIDLASLTVSDASTSGLRLWTAKLSATLATRPAPPDEPLCLRLTDTSGRQYLLGLAQRPHLLIAFEDRAPARATDACACTLSATLTAAPWPVMEIR